MKIFGTDYDGVIINIEPQKASAFGKLLKKEWGINEKKASKFWIEKGGTSRRYKFEYLYTRFLGKDLPDDIYKIIEAKFSKILVDTLYPRVKILDGAIELLKYARENFDFTFISSGVSSRELEYLVGLNKLTDYFDQIYGTDDLHKSKEDHFRAVLADKNPDLFVFLADSPEDMRVANNFKAISIGITTNHSGGELIKSGADIVCKNLKEALAEISQL